MTLDVSQFVSETPEPSLGIESITSSSVLLPTTICGNKAVFSVMDLIRYDMFVLSYQKPFFDHSVVWGILLAISLNSTY